MKRAQIEPFARNLESIAANIRALRRREGITQEQLAERCDVDLRFLQRIERGSANFSISVLIGLASALAVPPETLLRPATLTPARPGRPPRRKSVPPPPHDDDGSPHSSLRPRGVGTRRSGSSSSRRRSSKLALVTPSTRASGPR